MDYFEWSAKTFFFPHRMAIFFSLSNSHFTLCLVYFIFSIEMTSDMPINVMRRHLLTIENLRDRVRRVLKCVINLHIEFLVLESHVAQLMDEVRALNSDFVEVKRLDALIETLRNYDGPTICHEWPYPLIFKGTIDNAEIAQKLNELI